MNFQPRTLILLLAFLLVALLAIYLITEPTPSPSEKKPAAAETNASPHATTPPAPPSDSTTTSLPQPQTSTNTSSTNPEIPTPPSTDWQEFLSAQILSDLPHHQVASNLVTRIPSAPPEARPELAQHAVNLTPDEHYPILYPVLLNLSGGQDAAEVVFNDLLNRPDPIKLPILAQIYLNPNHPFREQASEILQLFLNEITTDPSQLQSKIQAYLGQ